MSAIQAINDKLQGSVATYLRCGGVVNNQIKKGLLLSLWVKNIKSVNIWQKLQARALLSHALWEKRDMEEPLKYEVFLLIM